MFVLNELHEDLHNLAAGLLSGREHRAGCSSEPDNLQDDACDARVRFQGATADSGEEELGTLADLVRGKLPWQSAITGEPVAMAVLGVGLLEDDHDLYPIGTPYVTVAVDTWDAADAVRHALDDVAGLDEASWALDWFASDDAFRTIRIFPSSA